MTSHRIPRFQDDDYTPEAAGARRQFLLDQTGVALDHVAQHSFDPAILPGNIENFTGVVQMPLGFAGPLRVNGEHAQGDFYVPMATTEGTLVASYSRGMSLTRQAHVICKATFAHQQPRIFLARHRLSNPVKTHCSSLR